MPIAFDAASNGGYSSASGNDSWDHTNAGNYMLVAVAQVAAIQGVPATVTYGSRRGTHLGGYTFADVRVDMFEIRRPAVGTHTIYVEISAFSTDFVGMAASFSGVHRVRPIAKILGLGSASYRAVLTVPVVVNNAYVVDAVATADGSILVGGDQAEMVNVAGFSGTGGMSYRGAITPVPVTFDIEWTEIGIGPAWAYMAVVLRPAEANPHINTFVVTRRKYRATHLYRRA